MPKFTIIKDLNSIRTNDNWVDSLKFDSKNRLVNQKWQAISSSYQGRQYLLVAKKEHEFSSFERFGRGFLGVLVVVASLGLALLISSVWMLFTTSREKIRYAIEVNKITNLFDSEMTNKILQKTLTSLKQSLVMHWINDFNSAKMVLKINDQIFQWATDDTINSYNTNNLTALEEPAKQMIQKITEMIAIDNAEQTSIEWKFTLTNDAGIHEFRFFFEKRPGFTISNGALFGVPGYCFTNPLFEVD